MDADRFDELSRSVAQGTVSRRRVFRVLGAGVGTGITGSVLRQRRGSAQINFGTIICPILRQLQNAYCSGIPQVCGIFNSLLAAYGCNPPAPTTTSTTTVAPTTTSTTTAAPTTTSTTTAPLPTTG